MTNTASPAGTPALTTAGELLESYGYQLALVVACVATLGSLYFSEVRGFEPCRLCWYQRIAMYPLVLLIGIGLQQRDRLLYRYVIPMAFVGATLSVYHLSLQWGLIQESIACQKGVPCSGMYILWFGFVTIPLLALVAFVLIILTSSAARRGPTAPRSSERTNRDDS